MPARRLPPDAWAQAWSVAHIEGDHLLHEWIVSGYAAPDGQTRR